MTIIFLRHAETEWNDEGRFASRSDVPLSTFGEQQAAQAGRRLAHVPLGRIVSSPSVRAVATAQAVLRERPTPSPKLETDGRLVELDFGDFEGLTAQELSNGSLSRRFENWRAGLDGGRIPGARETITQAAMRARSVFAEVADGDTGGAPTLVVSHAHLIRILLCVCVLGSNPLKHRHLRLDPCGFAKVRRYDSGWRLVALQPSLPPTDCT